MTKGPNPTIAVHLTQKELALLNRILEWPYSSTLADKLRKATVDIRPIIRDARREAKVLKETEEPYDGYMIGDNN